MGQLVSIATAASQPSIITSHWEQRENQGQILRAGEDQSWQYDNAETYFNVNLKAITVSRRWYHALCYCIGGSRADVG